MKYREPPQIDPDRIRFAEDFHPIDHSIWNSCCRTLPGGRRRHLVLEWRYRWSEDLRAVTKCRPGLHRAVQWWRCDPPGVPATTFMACRDCGRRLSAEQPR